jgi:hypothetical protein
MNNIDVYIAAEKFGISDLKRFSGARIKHWLNDNANMKSNAFLIAANEILDCSPSGDIDPTLQNYLAKTISKSHTQFIANQEFNIGFLHLIRKSGILGASLVEKMQTINKELALEVEDLVIQVDCSREGNIQLAKKLPKTKDRESGSKKVYRSRGNDKTLQQITLQTLLQGIRRYHREEVSYSKKLLEFECIRMQ